MDKDQRIQELLEANNRYVENNRKLQAGLRRARDKFSFYAENHWAKTSDSSYTAKQQYNATQKARANEDEVKFIDELLKKTAPI